MKRFVTEYEKGGELFGGTVDAIDWQHAELVANQLDPPQKVQGVLYAVIVADHWTTDDADRFMKALADTNDEPPESHEFDN